MDEIRSLVFFVGVLIFFIYVLWRIMLYYFVTKRLKKLEKDFISDVTSDIASAKELSDENILSPEEENIRREYLFQETEIVQGIISRMGNNSFLIKGWSITLVVVSLLFKGTYYHHFVAFIPWGIFWWLDAYFLRLEKLYRKWYDWLIENRLTNEDFLLDVNNKRLEENYGKEISSELKIMFSKTLGIFYGLIFCVIVIVIIFDFCIGA